MDKIFIEKESLLFALCSTCDFDMDCPDDIKKECPILQAVECANYIEIPEDNLDLE